MGLRRSMVTEWNTLGSRIVTEPTLLPKVVKFRIGNGKEIAFYDGIEVLDYPTDDIKRLSECQEKRSSTKQLSHLTSQTMSGRKKKKC